MKRAVSISIGSSKRNKAVTVKLLGEDVSIERIGTDGDMEAAALKYKELDGKVDAFGVGGADLGVMVDDKWYRLYSVEKMVRYIKKTPVVDGTGLKNTLENKAAAFCRSQTRRLCEAARQKSLCHDRRGPLGADSFLRHAGYEATFGDLMFSLGIPIALHTEKQLKTLAALAHAGCRTPALRVGLPDRRKAGGAQAEISQVFPVGDGGRRRLPLHQALHAG